MQGRAHVGLRLCLAAILGVGATASFGQATTCPDIENDAERLACYDRALRPSRAPTAPTPQTAPAAATATAPATAPAVAMPAGGAVVPAATAAVAPPTTVTVAPSPPSTPAPAAAKDGPVTIVIVAAKTVQGRGTTFTAEDGTVWTQNDGQTISNLPDTPFDAELKPGALGSRFLVPEGQTRSIRVRLVR